jgi:hypothetical protein
MSLKPGKSKKVIAENVGELVRSFKDTGKTGTSHPANVKKAQQQATAIAYDKAGKARKK